MATSTIPTFKAALVARLQADAGLTGVQVSYGLPYPSAIEREAVLVLGTRADDPTGGSGGQRAADETDGVGQPFDEQGVHGMAPLSGCCAA